ncbi:DUF4349 domain-containing protein [Streptomyces sp. NBC_01571]|uniref:DUF4349 domain-containing protein n=1 Tax=Streptomyces sp. NBC_01571 TaxID=2975883 RepID=UPI00224CB665|nr:DUF4349 domain-containing protein [Streptomyces sp. NBC_01571]MCX4578203.1 DUF4349 domain-containing protein [Streptomyces sp. NBC_01571]
MHTPRSVRRIRTGRALAGVLLVSSLALAGCGAAGDGGTSSDKAASGDRKAGPGAKEAAPGTADSAASDSAASGAGGSRAATAPRLDTSGIIRTAFLTVQVKDVPEALDRARVTATGAGGFVGDETTTRDGRGHERTRVVLRVPTDRYDQVLADLGGAGKILERTAKAQDVTDQVVDVESRIKSQRASVARVRGLMDRAAKLSDVVALEGELSSREADLEALLARQSSLKDRTSLATITLSLSETPVRKAAEKAGDPGFVDALAGGWDAFVTTLRWIAMVLGAVLPFAVCAAVLVVLWLRFGRSRLPRRRASVPAVSGAGSLPAAPPVRGEGGKDA